MQRFIGQYHGQELDALIVGGGITGCAVAYEAASRGLSVALVEKADFGGATSAATSKLIHGGLRYIKNLEVSLMRESLAERRILSNIAPNLVRPLAHLFPVYGRKPGARWVLGAVLTAYDLMAWDKQETWDPAQAIPNHIMVGPARALELEPRLRQKGLKTAAMYYDCQNLCPERLTLTFLKSAAAHGALAANYAKVARVLKAGNRVAGAAVQDLTTGGEHEIKARLVINCAGPWADSIPGASGPGNGRLLRSEGIHIITPPIAGDLGLVMAPPAGGHLFVLPWRGHTLIGTTDRQYDGDPDGYRVQPASVLQMIDTVNSCFGDGNLGLEQVLYAYGGLRPLVDDGGGGTYKASRKYEIRDHEADGLPGLISAVGGKYTTSRHLAQRVVDLAGAVLGRDIAESISADTPLAGCGVGNVAKFVERMQAAFSSLEPATMRTLVRYYGSDCQDVAELALGGAGLGAPLNHEGEVLAQVQYAVEQEMALTLCDILLRRTGLGTLGDPGPRVLDKAAALAAGLLGWDDERRQTELARARQALAVPGKEVRP